MGWVGHQGSEDATPISEFSRHPQMSKDQLQHYSELAGKELEVGPFMTYIMKYMMDKGLKLANTEGMIEASVFPVNYFTLKQVRVYFGYR